MAVLLELNNIKWDVVGLNEVRRIGGPFIVFPDKYLKIS